MYMIRLKSILLERVDFHQIATQIVKDAGLKSTVKFTALLLQILMAIKLLVVIFTMRKTNVQYVVQI